MKHEKLRHISLSVIPYAIAFLLAFGISILTYRVLEIIPFGENSIISMDLWAQYYPMYAETAQTDSLADLFYSWNGGLGYNRWAQSAYYSNSIFALLLPLIPLHSLLTFIDWLAPLKIALSAVTCLGFLRYKTQSRTPVLIGGAVAYATCTYMLAFIQQVMWTDCVIYLPLLLIGLERLMHEKKPLLYTLMLALILITNFYIGFAICIFCCLYFAAGLLPTAKFERNKRNTKSKYLLTNAKELGFSVLRFSVFSILGGAIAAAVLLPMALALSHTISSGLAAPDTLEWYGNISEILQHMLPTHPISIKFDGFNLSVGIAVFLLVPLYFCNKGFSIGERVADGCLLAFLGVSLLCNFLDYFWHGMHFPNQLPARWTFLFSLVLVLLACKGIAKIKEVSLPFGIISVVIGFLAVILGTRGFGDTEPFELGMLHWCLLVLVAVLIIALIMLGKVSKKAEKREKAKRIFSVVCTLLMAGTMVFDSGYSFLTTYKNTEHTFFMPRKAESYRNRLLMESHYGNAYSPDENECYRVEANGGYIYDAPMLGDYPGVTYYSSTMRGSSYRLLQYLGNHVYAKNVSSMYTNTSPVQNALLGIRYFLDYTGNLHRYVPNLTEVENAEDCTVRENQTALSVGYAVSDDILNLNITDEVRGIQNQNTFLNKLCGKDMGVFKQLKTTHFSSENTKIDDDPNWNKQYFTATGDEPTIFHYTYACEKDGFFYLENNFRAGNILVQSNEKEQTLKCSSYKFKSLGYYKAGDEIRITVTLEGYKRALCGLNLYYFDQEAWQNAYQQLSSEQIEVETFKNTYLKGNIQLADNRLVMTTIPQDGGWTVYCDGKKTEPKIIAGELIGIHVPKGSHTLEFRYRVPGLAAGAIVSVLGLLLTFLLTSDKLRNAVTKKSSAEGKSEKS